MNSALEYLKLSSKYPEQDPERHEARIKVNLITNFTDEILLNIFKGVSLYNGVYPTLYKVPYQQYHLALKQTEGPLFTANPDLTFIFFDANPFKESPVKSSKAHFEEILKDIEEYCKKTTGTVVLNHCIVSYQGAYGNLFRHSPFFNLVQDYNRKIDELKEKISNLVVCDTNRLVHLMGESHVFDLRGLYAFDIPFTHEFLTALAEEWFTFVRAIVGKTKKCIVLDLDNTLWGGVVGELGPLAIALGEEYPGNAFLHFQRALLDFYHRGIILALTSKNNEADVMEVFEKNPHMVLQRNHFAAIRINWEEKAGNLESIAKELNIGVESMVFFDDSPFERDLVRTRFPQITVPELSVPPEEYMKVLYGLDVFNQLSLTEEDTQKGRMYAEERQRKEAHTAAKNIEEYIAGLHIVIKTSINDKELIPRLSQLTQKTNQCNVTTKRYTEHDISTFIENGTQVIAGTVSDKFGEYGTVILAIVIPHTPKKNEAMVDSFLMSCRVMGRGIECRFIDYLARELYQKGFTTLHASFSPTAKNKPAEKFFSDHGFNAHKAKAGTATVYTLDLKEYEMHPCAKINNGIQIKPQ